MSERITYSQIDELTTGKDRQMARLIEQACHDINTAEQSIQSKLAWVEDTVARVRRQLAAGQGLNSMGEFQRTPAELDMAIAARQAAWQLLGRMVGPEAASALATAGQACADCGASEAAGAAFTTGSAKCDRCQGVPR